MKILVTIPHYFKARHRSGYGSTSSNPERRIQALSQCILALYHLYGKPHCELDQNIYQVVPFQQKFSAEVHIVICTTGTEHLVSELPVLPAMYRHHSLHLDNPMMLGVECHALLRDTPDQYDYYVYLEDDIVMQDPLFFIKLRQFTDAFGPMALLQPHRFETSYRTPIHKAYIDGNLNPQVTARFQNIQDQPVLHGQICGVPVRFKRVLNPHAGLFLSECGANGVLEPPASFSRPGYPIYGTSGERRHLGRNENLPYL